MSKNHNLSGNLFTKQPLTVTETALSAMIAEWLDVQRIYNDRLNSGKVKVVRNYQAKGGWKTYENWLHLCKEGTPDRFALVEGFIIFIEVKKKDKKPTDVQLDRHNELQTKAKAFVIAVDSFDDFQIKFKEVISRIRQRIASNEYVAASLHTEA